MLKQRPKFYQLSPLEQQTEQISGIYKMINQQQKNMDDILSKYETGQMDNQGNYRSQMKTIQAKTNIKGSRSLKKGRSNSTMNNEIVTLPSISPSNKLQKKRKVKKSPDYAKNPYLLELKGTEDREKMKQVLQRAYLTEKSEKITKIRNKDHSMQIKKEQIRRSNLSNITPELQKEKNFIEKVQIDQEQKQKSIPQPLSYFKKIQKDDSDSSSNEGDIPLSYYERQFRGTIRSQSLEQTNFLYFSKNQSMKDWTEGLLLMFEKHDKQLALLRKKCRYLEKFDNTFFSIDIFRND